MHSYFGDGQRRSMKMLSRQHHAVVAQKIHLSCHFRFPQPPLRSARAPHAPLPLAIALAPRAQDGSTWRLPETTASASRRVPRPRPEKRRRQDKPGPGPETKSTARGGSLLSAKPGSVLRANQQSATTQPAGRTGFVNGYRRNYLAREENISCFRK